MAAFGVAMVLCASLLTGCESFDETEVSITIGEDQVSAGMANFFARMQQAQYESYYANMMGTTGKEMWGQKVDDKNMTFEESVKEGLLTSLENMYLLKQHAEEFDVVITPEEQKEIEKAAEKFLDANALEDKEAVSGTVDNVEEFLQLATIQKKMEGLMKAGVNEEVTDEEAEGKDKASIIEERKQAKYDDLLEAWRNETKIEVNEKVWEQIDFQKLGVTVKDSADQYEDGPVEVE